MNPSKPKLNLIFATAALLFLSAVTSNAQKVCPSSPGTYLGVFDAKHRYGFIDSKGAIVLPPEKLPERVAFATDFSEGLAAVGVNSVANKYAGFSSGTTKIGFIDTTGKFVIEPQFDYAYGFCEGLAFVDKGEFRGYIDRSGKVVVDLKTDCAAKILSPAALSRCPRQYGGYVIAGEESEGLTAMTDGRLGRDAKYGFADKQGRMLISPRFEPELEHHGAVRYLSKFVEGRAKVKLDGLYGYIDKKGKQVIPARFSTASNFSDGLAFVIAKDGQAGYIDKGGRWRIKANGWATGGGFSDGFAPVATETPRGGMPRWGYIDRKGKIVIPLRFDGAQEFRNGVARIYEVGSDPDSWWESRFGFIDKSGKYLWKPNSTFVSSDMSGNRH